MNKKIRIGVVCLARKTYDFKAADKIYKETLHKLGEMCDVEWTAIPELVIEVEDAKKAAAKFAESHLDGMIIITGTFHLGHLALIFKNAVNIPTLLWGFNELPYNGGKIRLNSVCGLNLNASNLYKAGYNDVCCTLGDTIDNDWLNAVRMKASLSKCHIGIVGYRADGFFNLDIDEMDTYKKTGILVDHYEICDVTSIPVKDSDVSGYGELIKNNFDCNDVNSQQVRKVEELCAKFEGFMKKYDLTAVAVRCWPEFANTFGISPCAAMSILQSKNYLLGCEGDIEGLMSMVICDAISDLPPFLADLSQVDFKENSALLWHCGVAPMNLWDGLSTRSLDTYFAGGRGVTTGFVLKSGAVNVVRIDSARGKTRLFLEGGNVVPMQKQLTGTYGKTIFDHNVKDVLDTVTSTGIAHHIALIYGEYKRAFSIFADMMGYEIITPKNSSD
jgi:L-fucose isomerase-like protein